MQLLTNNLEETFRALRNRDPSKLSKSEVPQHQSYKPIPRQNYAPTSSAHTQWGNGMAKFASAASAGTIYGQPQFFSPVHTPINWQIPSKRLEQYQWMFLPGTEVLSDDFTYSYLEKNNFGINLTIQDEITGGYVFDIKNYPMIMDSEGGFRTPPRISARDCENKTCFSFESIGYHRSLQVTEEHHIFVLDGEKFRGKRRILSNESYRRKNGVFSNGISKIKQEMELIKRVRADKVKKDDYLLSPVPNTGNITIDSDLAWLIGYCAADGTIYKSPANYCVSFTGHKDELSLKKCEILLRKYFSGKVSSKKHGDGNGWRVRLGRKEAYEFFRKYIINSGVEKKFTKALFSLDKESRLHVLGGYLDGDGSFVNSQIVANCYSRSLSDQIYWLFLSCDICPSINKHKLYNNHYKTSSICSYFTFVPSSEIEKIREYLRSEKIPCDFIPKIKRNLRFFYEEEGIKYLAQPIKEIKKFSYSGYGYDIEMTNERRALVADGYVASNSRFFYECFTPDNLVLMSDGTEKKINEIKIGDMVISGDGSSQKVKNVFRRSVKENILSISVSGNTREITCTKNHEIPRVSKKLWDLSYETTCSKNIIRSRYRKNGEVEMLEKWSSADTLTDSDRLFTPCSKIGSGLKLSIKECYLLGSFAAEGCYYWYKGKEEYVKAVRWTINKSEKDTFGKKICDILRGKTNNKISCNVYDRNPNAYNISVSDVKLSSWFFDIIGSGAHTKNIKDDFINNANRDQLVSFLSGYIDGDGCFNKNNGCQIVTCSDTLSSQICFILEKLGKTFSLTETKSKLKGKIFNGYNIRISRQSCEEFQKYSFKVCKNTPHHTKYGSYLNIQGKHFRKISDITEVYYEGDVYDLEIENVHSYCVNRCVVHNSEPKVAAAMDFYSYFPMSDWEHEVGDPKIKLYFDKFKKRLQLPKWCRLISHEVHLLGDCFPFAEIHCPICQGGGMTGDEVCNHEGGTVGRMIILNPDYVDVHTPPLNPDPIISLRPDEELINMVQRKTPGYERLSPEVISLVSSGQPIRLDNRNVSHLKYGESGYTRYGIGMIRRLFPILSYKTKLMVAQWIVAERLIVPIKIVKVGSDERPAGPADIAAVQAQLAETANDPNLTIVTHHAFDFQFEGASGKVLTLSNEFEFINQEVLDGMMINNALLNGEGPNFASASVGIEAMIQRLDTFRNQISDWIIEFLYLPEAKRQGFVEIDQDTGEEEFIVPKIKWNSMHLRDQQQYRTFIIQLYEKGLVSAQTVLEAFDIDPDQEIERKRYDAVQMMALGQGTGQQQQDGGMGGGFGGGMDLGGGGMGLGGGGGMGGEPPIGPGGDLGGAPATPTGGAPMAKTGPITADIADPNQFGGKVLKKKSRDKYVSEKQKMHTQIQKSKPSFSEGEDGQVRDEKGRIAFTKIERELMDYMIQYQKDGIIKYPITPQYRIMIGNVEYPVDFALPNLKIIIEADGEIYHSAPKQVQKDNERDRQLAQMGWTVLRFKDREIEKQPQQVMSKIVQTIMKKEMSIQNNQPK